MKDSKIQWTDHTFNPWIGCDQVSPGCLNCYAKDLMEDRYKRVEWGQGEPRSRTSAANWREPLKWNKQAAITGERFRVFCASLADVFDEEVPVDWFQDFWGLIQETPNLDWLLLTKRPENIHEFLYGDRNDRLMGGGDFMPNVWLGTTVENQQMADKRIPLLLEIPAAVRFLSCEPLLGEVDLEAAFSVCDSSGEPSSPRCNPDSSNAISWVIIGGESGNKARPFHLSWARSLIRQCQEAQVSVFMKQVGSNSVCDEYDSGAYWHIKGKGGDIEDFPEDMRVREFPQVLNEVKA